MEDDKKEHTDLSLNDLDILVTLESSCKIKPSGSSELSDKNTPIAPSPDQCDIVVHDQADVQKDNKSKKGINSTKKGNLV